MTLWKTPILRLRILMIIGFATIMTVFAEFLYFTIWGLWLFPDGDLISKAVWTFTCGIAMGFTIGASTLLLVEGNLIHHKAIISAAAIMSLVGIGCAILCSQIDQHFNYFGGREHSGLFLLSGIIPAIIGGVLYGWALYSSRLFDALFDQKTVDR